MTAATLDRVQLAHDIELAGQHLREDPQAGEDARRAYHDLCLRWDGRDTLTRHAIRPELIDADGDHWWWDGDGYRRPHSTMARTRSYIDRYYGPVRRVTS